MAANKSAVVYKSILENMTDGVMTLDLKGRIVTFNKAASHILGLDRKVILGKNFAEIFFEFEGNDDFNQSILDAIYDSDVGHTRIVEVNTGKKQVALSLNTSFLQAKKGDTLENIGVIAVFSDISELKKLRDAEIQLTEDIKSKHKELQSAYLKIEDNNETLRAALKKVQVVRITATLFIICLFVGTGIYIWKKDSFGPSKPVPIDMTQVPSIDPTQAQTSVVRPQSITSSISMPGILEPLNVVNVVCPFGGKVKASFFNYGDRVKKGQLLAEMDTSDLLVKYRDARSALIKAMQRFREIKNWSDESEVHNARRSLTKAQRALESQRRKLQETERLFNKGIVPASEYESTKEQYENQQLDLTAAQDALTAVLEKGNRENIDIVRFEMENAKIKVEDLSKQLGLAKVAAPVSGVVIRPGSGGSEGGKNAKDVEKGVSYDQGQAMISIGDMKGMSVKCSVDEVDIMKIEQGQPVQITGDAFPRTKLMGEVAFISSQAVKEGQIPKFDVTVHITRMTPEQKEAIRLGMSANLEVMTYNKPDALLAPLDTMMRKGADWYIRVKDKKTNRIKEVKVKAGVTTLDSVEIIEGLTAGDEIVMGQ